MRRLAERIDPTGTLPPPELAIRVEHALKAEMLALAARSAASRRRKSAGRLRDLAVEANAAADELEQSGGAAAPQGGS